MANLQGIFYIQDENGKWLYFVRDRVEDIDHAIRKCKEGRRIHGRRIKARVENWDFGKRDAPEWQSQNINEDGLEN